MSTLIEMIHDPVFQLNTLLWLTQPISADGRWKPLLRNAGFEVYAIAPMLAPPPDVLLALKESQLQCKERCRPDIVLNRDSDHYFMLVECKGGSFSAASTTAEQARTFLVVCGPRLHDSLGIHASDVEQSIAAYLVAEDDMSPMQKTLEKLSEEINTHRLQAGHTEFLGLRFRDNSLLLVVDNILQSILGLTTSAEKFLEFDPDTDPRPLYIVPYDPDCDQTEEERVYCKRVLFERIHAAILGTAGRTIPPQEIVFKTENLLNDALMGMYDLWENQDSSRHMRQITKQLLSKLSQVVCGKIENTFVFEEGVGWRLRLLDQNEKNSICDVLSRFSCETMNLKLAPEPDFPDFFD